MKKFKSDECDVSSSYVHMDPGAREIYVFGSIDSLSCMSFVMALRALNRDSSKDVRLVINCEGGSETDGWAIYDCVKNSKALVMAEVYGSCMSMAMVILQACEHRAVASNSRLMIHDGSMECEKVTMARFQVQAKELQELTVKYYEALARRSNLSYEQVEKLCLAETYMSAEVAVGYGFADKIIGCDSKKAKGLKLRLPNSAWHRDYRCKV